jgi:TolB-like protein/Tfp pilus assembly protein PilF
MAGQTVAFGPFLLDPRNGTLFRDGELIAIGQKAALLLGALAANPGKVHTKAELMDAAWPGTTVEESNLSVQIGSLRKLLGPTPAGGEWIATIPRVGYRFVPEPDATHPSASVSEPLIPSLAVLPFQNMSGDREQDYFADGIVEDIITALSRFKSFTVIARNSSFVYKDRAVDVRQVAAELGVRYVLEGSVRRAGQQLRITAQLIDATSGAHIWADRFDGAVEDVFDLQDRITDSVATIIAPQIREAEIERSRRERPGSLAAYDLYLRALPKHRAATLKENEEAFALLSQAIALEPNNATMLAWALDTLHCRTIVGWPGLTGDDRALCRELAHRALAHARDDATVLAFSGIALVTVEKEGELGIASLARAVETNPNNIDAIIRAGIGNIHRGSLDDALGYFNRALRLSTSDLYTYVTLTGIAHVHMLLGNYEEALANAERSLAINAVNDPTYWMLIAGNAQLGRMEDARSWLAKFLALVPGMTVARIKAGQPDKDPSRLAPILEGLRMAGLAEE